MNAQRTICLLNDSFPPEIDGVVNAVMNYAEVLHKEGSESIVITPSYPGADDSAFPYEVLRYPSIDLRARTGYMAGVPFSPEIVRHLKGKSVSLLHTHCPIVSTMLGRELRQITDSPLVLTYHTKFDIDIANIMQSAALQAGSKRALVANINACDEVWAVSEGAAENLRSLGYEGDCIVMRNGVDLPRERVNENAIARATAPYDLPAGIPVFLFVGRIMWYKGLRIIEDALAKLKLNGNAFRTVFIGSGGDFDAVKEYAAELGILDSCIFTGAIHDREILRAWYCRADLFLFPSSFDTNGLVVREAAACSLAAVLIRGSCAAEGVADGQNGFLIEENADSMFDCLRKLCDNPQLMKAVGENAARELYISWEDAVKTAMDRYEVVIENHQNGAYAAHRKRMDAVFRANGNLMEDLAHLQDLRHGRQEHIHGLLAEHREHIRDVLENPQGLFHRK